MKIEDVRMNRRKKSFLVRTETSEYVLPFAKLDFPPTEDDPIEDVFVDPELGNEAFTYRLRSGVLDSVHIDTVRYVALDPDYLQELLLYRLTVEAQEGLEESGLGKRQVARILGTSPSQLYRLLDQTNSSKSVGQMLALLHLVDREVVVEVGRRGEDWEPKDVTARLNEVYSREPD